MTNALAIRTSAAQVAELHDADERAREYIGASTAASTIRAYSSDWLSFTACCEDHGLESLPASSDAVIYYIAAMSDHLKPATLSRRVAALSQRHEAAGLDSPRRHLVVRKVMAGVRRMHGTAQRRVSPLTVDDLRAICGSHIEVGAQGVAETVPYSSRASLALSGGRKSWRLTART